MFYSLDRLKFAADEIRSLRRAVCRFASMPMASFEILPLALRKMVERFDGIDISHDVHGSPRILNLLASRQIDLGRVKEELSKYRHQTATRISSVIQLPGTCQYTL